MQFEELAERYRGARAKNYDAMRAKRMKWNSEQRIVGHMLEQLPLCASVIDIPVGTGRFIGEYHRLHLTATGMDISPDMIALAAGKALRHGLDMPFHVADIRKIDAADAAFDAAVCICFLNWVGIDGARQAVRELVRVTRKVLILSIRHYAPLATMRPATAEGFAQWLLQMAVRIHKRIFHEGLRIHEEAEVFSMFKENGLQLKRRSRVEPRKYGTDYYIYFLEKSR